VKSEGVAKCENPPVRTLKIDHYYILPQWLISSPPIHYYFIAPPTEKPHQPIIGFRVTSAPSSLAKSWQKLLANANIW